MKISTKHIVMIGLLTAISIILTRFASVMIGLVIRLSFGEIPVMLSGILFGPVVGAFTGVVADLVGFTLNSHGAAWPHPGMTVSWALIGALPVLVLRWQRRVSNFTYLHLAIAVGITEVIAAVTLNTLWISQILNQGFWVLLPMRALARLLLFVPYLIILKRLHVVLKNRI